MKSNQRGKQSIMWYLFLGIACIIWITMMYLHISNYFYLYPTIKSVDLLIKRTLINCLLPVVPLAVALICIINRKFPLAMLFIFLFIPVQVFSSFRGAAEMLFSPSICSYTDNVLNFGIYDKRLQESLELNPVTYFPCEIPSSVKNVEYCYYYEYASDESVYISVSWEFNNERDYATIAAEIRQAASYSDGQGFYFSGSYYNNIIFLDDETCGITYVITSENDIQSSTFSFQSSR